MWEIITCHITSFLILLQKTQLGQILAGLRPATFAIPHWQNVIHFGEFSVNNLASAQNPILAVIWLVIGLAVVSAAIAALMGNGPFIAPALLVMSVILFMLSAQRTQRFAMEPTKFKRRMRFVAFATVILSSLSIVFNSAVQ